MGELQYVPSIIGLTLASMVINHIIDTQQKPTWQYRQN